MTKQTIFINIFAQTQHIIISRVGFIYNVICNKKEGSTVWSTELNGTYNISYSSSQSVEITWDISPTPDNKSVRITATSRRL